MEILNEAVMLVWGWRASCPAASWASFCCGGLTEPKEEAHFRVIYYHPNTSCLLRGLRKALATPFLGGTSSPCKSFRAPSLTYGHIPILIMYFSVCMYTHIYVCVSVSVHTFSFCFLFSRIPSAGGSYKHCYTERSMTKISASYLPPNCL